MSDLDADLYGGKKYVLYYLCWHVLTKVADLYGNDEGETEQLQEEHDATVEPTGAETEAAPAQTDVTEAPAKSVVETPKTNGTPTHTNGSTPSTFTQQAPQQIPTYEQPSSNEYRETPAARTDGGYQTLGGAERSVRPSEMKDEG